MFTLEELQKMNKNELITIIGNYISDQEIWMNQVKVLEKQNDTKSAEIEQLTKKDNGKSERSPFLMCEDYDAYLESMSKTELLEYFHFVMGNYRHSLDKVTLENSELQKQVDELKGKICELVANKCNLVVKEKQIVKDTARECIRIIDDEFNKMIECINVLLKDDSSIKIVKSAVKGVINSTKDNVMKRYSVEVG